MNTKRTGLVGTTFSILLLTGFETSYASSEWAVFASPRSTDLRVPQIALSAFPDFETLSSIITVSSSSDSDSGHSSFSTNPDEDDSEGEEHLPDALPNETHLPQADSRSESPSLTPNPPSDDEDTLVERPQPLFRLMRLRQENTQPNIAGPTRSPLASANYFESLPKKSHKRTRKHNRSSQPRSAASTAQRPAPSFYAVGASPASRNLASLLNGPNLSGLDLASESSYGENSDEPGTSYDLTIAVDPVPRPRVSPIRRAFRAVVALFARVLPANRAHR